MCSDLELECMCWEKEPSLMTPSALLAVFGFSRQNSNGQNIFFAGGAIIPRTVSEAKRPVREDANQNILISKTH